MQTNLDIISYISTTLGIPPVLLALLVIWSLVWMAIAMWIAARKDNKVWYVVFLLIHTLGILEILYIFVFSKMGAKSPAQSAAVRKKKK